MTAAGDSPRDAGAIEEHEAVTALERLGLSNYEARVLIALQKLGVGTAKEVHDVAGVPRSQVYGAAEELQVRGLIELQQSTPKRYRPVDPETAREKLMASLQRDRQQAFDYLESVRSDRPNAETRDDVWTVRGTAAISARVVKLIERTDDRAIVGASAPDLLDEAVGRAILAAAESGVDVTVVSENAEVRAAFDDAPVRVQAPANDGSVSFTGRVLVGDESSILLSVRPGGASSPETAIWSANTALADVLVQMVETGIAALVRG
ncbi:MAG: TrmB family transcriptional regulator [Salinigranum sp.]